jgi:hypothetical protein
MLMSKGDQIAKEQRGRFTPSDWARASKTAASGDRASAKKHDFTGLADEN